MRIASHLGHPLSHIKTHTTSREFIRWLIWLDEQEVKPPTRIEQYLARIAMEVQRTINPKASRKLKLKDFLLTFVYKSKHDKKPHTELSSETKKRLAMNAKAPWIALCGPPPELKKD